MVGTTTWVLMRVGYVAPKSFVAEVDVADNPGLVAHDPSGCLAYPGRVKVSWIPVTNQNQRILFRVS